MTNQSARVLPNNPLAIDSLYSLGSSIFAAEDELHGIYAVTWDLYALLKLVLSLVCCRSDLFSFPPHRHFEGPSSVVLSFWQQVEKPDQVLL